MIAAVLAGLLAGGTFLAPWGLAFRAQWFVQAPSPTVVEEAPEFVVAWLPEPEPEPEPEPDPEPEPAPEVEDAAEAPPPPEVEPNPAPVGQVEGQSGPAAAKVDAGASRRQALLRRRRARARARRRRCAKPHPAVRKGQDGVVEVDAAYVREMTRNLKAFMSLGYSRPYNEDGVKGWYISGFNCRSPLFKAGLRRRDILLRVNGKKTRSWVGVFMLYQRLKRKREFEVELLRGGKPRRLAFRIVEDWSPTVTDR